MLHILLQLYYYSPSSTEMSPKITPSPGKGPVLADSIHIDLE